VNINEHISKYLINRHGGSERKETVLLDDGHQYILKESDPTRELHRDISYINNALSEYLGCHIYQSVDIPVQETMLGWYINKSGNQRLACLCRDVRPEGFEMTEFDKVGLSSVSTDGKTASLPAAKALLSELDGKISLEDGMRFYTDMFIVDSLIGNTDRHNGNWAILTNSDDTITYMSPVYDCGSSFSPMLSDENFVRTNVTNEALSTMSALVGEKGNRIQYYPYFNRQDLPAEIVDALKRVIPRINTTSFKEITEQIQTEGYISDIRKNFYDDLLQTRFDRMLLPALEKQFGLNSDKKFEETYGLFRYFVSKITEQPLFEPKTYIAAGHHITVIKVNNKYALSVDESGNCNGVIRIRSNNKDLRLAASQLQQLGLTADNLKAVANGRVQTVNFRKKQNHLR